MQLETDTSCEETDNIKAVKKNKDSIQSEKNKLGNKKLRSVLQAVAFSVVPIMIFYLMEFYEHTPWREVRSQAQIFNIVLLELLAWIMFVLCGRARIALQSVMIMAMMFGLTNHYVMKFRSTPFVPWDIYSIGTAASVVGNYDFALEQRVIVVSLLFMISMIGLHFWKFQIQTKIKFRLIVVILLLGILVGFVGQLQDEEFQTKNYLYPFLFTPGYMTKVNGMAVTFAMDLAYVKVDKPTGYKKEESEQLLETYEYGHPDINGNHGAKISEMNSGYPNIIVIMDEAFSDLRVLGSLPTNEDYMPFVHRLQQGEKNTVTGLVNVSVCGGNTANSEFEFLTGDTMAFLPEGSIPYQQYVKKDTASLATYLKELGYTTYAQHPYYETGWERQNVYPRLGFDELAFIKDFKNPQFLRKYVSDASAFEEIISTYEKKEIGKPAFIFQVTMQNHGGYSEEFENFSSDIKALGVEHEGLNQYLSLVKKTDGALEQLITYFEQQEEPTVIVFFGDHQPNDAIAAPVLALNGKNVKNLSKEEQQKRYQVPYVIWANYDIEEATQRDTSLNYLAADVLRIAGVETSAYQNFLLELESEFPVISAMQNPDWKDGLINQYRKLQYYQLFEK